MDQYIRVSKPNAEKLKRIISEKDRLNRKLPVRHSGNYVYLPLLNIDKERIKNLLGRFDARIVRMKKGEIPEKTKFADRLKGIVGDVRGGFAGRYDLLGDIAIMEIPPGLSPKEGEIAGALMDSDPKIRTVLAKGGPVSGTYRIRKVRYVGGRKNFIAEYRENGCLFRFDVRKTFFSVRLSYERTRISSLVGRREKVMVMFAGVGPFAIVIAKAHKDSDVVAIEANADACKAMVGNIAANKVQNVSAVLGDVRVRYKEYKNFADRVVMPLPMSAGSFLTEALYVAKDKAVVHLYRFCRADGGTEEVIREIKEHARGHGYAISKITTRVVRPYSPKEIEIVVDYTIRKGGKRG
jgi:tRNA (guanine37-N1)-methyltransferase